MKLTVINVGYGDAMLIEAQGGYTALIDGGSMLATEFAGDPYRIPAADYLSGRGIRRLDAVFITHIHEDHVCGLLPVFANFQVDQLYVPYPVTPFLQGRALDPGEKQPRNVQLYTAALNAYVRIIQDAVAKDMPVTTLKPGDSFQPEEGLSIETLAPKPKTIADYMSCLEQAWQTESTQERAALLTRLDASSNQTSLLFKLEAQGSAFLAAADNIPAHWDEVPFSSLQNVNVLKLPHHGQADAIDTRIMQEMPLKHVITTASSDRRYSSANDAVYRQLDHLFSEEGKPEFLFSDERSYAPWFSQPEGFHAITLVMDSGKIRTEFHRIAKEKNP